MTGRPLLDPTSAGRLLAAQRARHETRCEVCGTPFEATRRRRYCSGACSVRAWRNRRARSELSALVLIVDRDPLLLEALVLAFELGGLRAVTASNAEQYMQAIRRWHPALVLLDHAAFPGQRLPAALDLEDGPGPAPLVLMSARADTEQTARSVGAVAFLAKPFDIAHLLLDVKVLARSA